MDDLEEALSDILPAGFQIETNARGQVVIYTGLQVDEDGELVEIEDDLDEDLDFNSDFEPLEDEDQHDDE